MIELKNICWSTPDGKEILKDVNLKIKNNRLVAISGPNGSGKTTLARILMGIEMPSSGEILMDGEDITKLDVTERALKGISFGFQQPVSFKGITVKKILSLAAGKKLSDESVCDLLQKVGLCARKYINSDIDSTLSGGEIKRIEIATVLARNSDFIIFDEPEAGIDLWSFEKLIGVFEEMRNQKDRTIVVISHQERILRIADEIVIVSDGTVSDHGPGPEMIAKMTNNNHLETRRCGERKVNYE